MNSRLRAVSLPAVAVVLVSGVLATQLAYGGRTYEPLRPIDPCAARTVTSQSEGIEGLTERLVLRAGEPLGRPEHRVGIEQIDLRRASRWRRDRTELRLDQSAPPGAAGGRVLRGQLLAGEEPERALRMDFDQAVLSLRRDGLVDLGDTAEQVERLP